jgi:hypothetical protein
MKNRFNFFVIIILLLGVGFSIFTAIAQVKSNNFTQPNNGLQIEVSSAKDSYLLGEMVLLDFEVKNVSSTDVRVRGLDVDTRYVVLYIAYEGELFKKYNHSRVKEKGWWMLKPGQSVTSHSGILWNFSVMETSTKWKEMIDTDITSYYAFPKAGVYTVKAVLGIPGNESPTLIESKPIQVIINEPVGDDLEIWNIIKDKEEIGFFVQESFFRTFNPQETTKLTQEVEQISLKYPNSIIANQIKQSLTKFRAYKVTIKSAMEKAESNKPN